MVREYWRRPAKVEALKFEGSNKKEVKEFVTTSVNFHDHLPQCQIRTPRGLVICYQGDYIIKHSARDFCPVDPKTFHRLYEKVKK